MIELKLGRDQGQNKNYIPYYPLFQKKCFLKLILVSLLNLDLLIFKTFSYLDTKGEMN